MMNLILECIALVLCGAGIGAAVTWRIMYRPKPMTQERARREAERLYNRLIRDMEGAA